MDRAAWLAELAGAARGSLTEGDETPWGIVEFGTLTGYVLVDGSFVSFDRVHGRPAPVAPLVQFGGAL